MTKGKSTIFKNALLVLLAAGVLAGCQNEEKGAAETATAPASAPVKDTAAEPTPSSSGGTEAAPTTGSPELQTNDGNITGQQRIIPGTYIIGYYDPANVGIAEVKKLGGGDQYHLNVQIVRGFSHHNGEIDGDFRVDGQRLVFADELYRNVSLSFTDNALTIDYPEEDFFGGANAEPRDTYFLQNSGTEDAPFLSRLYDQAGVEEAYRNGFTDVYTYPLDNDENLLLLRSQSSVDRAVTASERIVIHNPKEDRFIPLGEVVPYDLDSIREQLKAYNVDEELVYEVTRKEYADRYKEVLMKRFDQGQAEFLNGAVNLTEEEAFYIVTGIENSTAAENNRRDNQNIGSIFIQEVDHADEQAVTIHIYEEVRNDETDTHTATADWLSVDRQTGRVVSELFD
ncbi:hypothetical protein LMZ02_18595 [Paenibacillus macerans]|uniref:hypothetical protein n=1 Tax=Paenibacillus macerans TaxID=44252 RepID=UPI001F0EBBD8|nr:hypothetical protein [Paenibacillus macerans]UMV45525.1 hypothetical protein LMZ02_18595 [Paenibacillus macerans]